MRKGQFECYFFRKFTYHVYIVIRIYTCVNYFIYFCIKYLSLTAHPIILLPSLEEASEDCAFKKTGKTIIKQMVSIRMMLDVTE